VTPSCWSQPVPLVIAPATISLKPLGSKRLDGDSSEPAAWVSNTGSKFIVLLQRCIMMHVRSARGRRGVRSVSCSGAADSSRFGFRRRQFPIEKSTSDGPCDVARHSRCGTTPFAGLVKGTDGFMA